MPTKVYTVVAGDYLARIAQDHATTVEHIWRHPQNAEHRRKRGTPDVLYPGDVLHIPIAGAPSSPPVLPPSPPPGPRPTPPLPPLGKPPSVAPWMRRAVARAKSGGPAKQALPPQPIATSIRLIGKAARAIVDGGWLLCASDQNALVIRAAPTSVRDKYRAHFKGPLNVERARIAKELKSRSLDPSRRLELTRRLGSLPNENSLEVWDLLVRKPFPALDPYRYEALLELAEGPGLDIIVTDFPIVRYRSQSPSKLFLLDDRKRKEMRAITLVPKAVHERAEAEIKKLYKGDAIESGRAYPLAGHPDASRWVVAVRATRPSPRTRGPLNASLTHEVFGHAYLGQRGHIADHVGLPHGPNRQVPKVRANLTAPLATSLPRAPLGSRFSGIGARHSKVTRLANGMVLRHEEYGPPGFTELFAGIQTEIDRFNVMPPTLGVGPSPSGVTFLADDAVRMFAVMSAASALGRLELSESTGMARLLPAVPDMPGLEVSVLELVNTVNNHYLCLMRLHLNALHVVKDSVATFLAQAEAFKASLVVALSAMRSADRKALRKIVVEFARRSGALSLRIRSMGPRAKVLQSRQLDWMIGGGVEDATLVNQWDSL